MSKLINRVTRNYNYTRQAFEPETPASHPPLPVHPSYLPAILHPATKHPSPNHRPQVPSQPSQPMQPAKLARPAKQDSPPSQPKPPSPKKSARFARYLR